jgi:hypothetical protein
LGEQVEKPQFHYERLLDPDAEKEVAEFQRAIDNYKCDIELKIEKSPMRLCRKGNVEKECVGTVGQDPTVEKRDGIFYRPALPYTIAFTPKKDKTTATDKPVITKTIYVPNSAPIFLFNITRPAFVKYTQTIEFDNGMLKSATIKKPSEAVGFLSIPINIAKAVVSIPSALFKFQIENSKNELTSQKEVLEAQKNLLEAEKQLLLKEEELRKLKTK